MDKRAKALMIQDLLPVGLTLVVGGIMLAFGAQVNGEVQDDNAECNSTHPYVDSTNLCTLNATETYTPTNAAFNISESAMGGMDNLSERFGTIGLVAAIVIVIGLLVSGFGYLMGRR